MAIRAEIDSSIMKVIKRLESKRVAFYKEAVGMMVDAIQEGDIRKAVLKPTFSILKKGLTDWVPDLLATKRFTGLVDLLSETLELKSYEDLLSKVFGSSLDISPLELSEARRYRQHIISTYGISLPTPG
jgi:hypothetical protein